MSSGLYFEGVKTDTTADHVLFGWSASGGSSGLNTIAPPSKLAGMALIWRICALRQRSAAFPYYSGWFHAPDLPDGTFAYDKDYVGAHPYANIAGGRTLMPAWELATNSVNTDGDDIVVYDNGKPSAVEFGQYPPVTADLRKDWQLQALTTRLITTGPDTGKFEWIYYTDLPDVSTATVITVKHTSKGEPTNPILSFGDATWNRGHEIMHGYVRFLHVYDVFMSSSALLSSVADPFAITTPWYLKRNPKPTDMADESGNGHNPAWANANRPLLWQSNLKPDNTTFLKPVLSQVARRAQGLT